MPNLNVDKDTCIGCGLCTSLSDAFQLDDEGKAECVGEAENADEVVASCPVQAISE